MRQSTWTLTLAGLVTLAAGCQPSAEETAQPGADPAPDDDQAQVQEGGQLAAGEPEDVVTGLEVPWGIGFLPDGSALVTERDSARVLRVTPDGDAEEVGQVDGVISEGEGGLMGVAVSPDFADDGAVYLYHTTATDNRIVRATFEPDAGLGEPEVVLDGIPRAVIHNGGRIAFGPDGMLYAGTGDADEAGTAQDVESLGGKVLRMTPDGEPAPDNPFDNLVHSYGHRNIQGLAWDDDDRLFAVEFGPEVDDEVNLVEPGANYGWPEVTGPAEREEYVDPVITWEDVTTASPSGADVAGGSLWVAALRGERLWQAPLAGGEGADALGEPEERFTGDHGRLRTVVATPEGDALWVTTSNEDGRGQPAADDDRILRVPLE